MQNEYNPVPSVNNPNDTEMFNKWIEVIHNRDNKMLRELLDDNVVFRSPAVNKPYKGKEATYLLLSTVVEVFQDFKYHRCWFNNGYWILEFTAYAMVDGKKINIHGIDMVEWNWESKKIVRFDVMVRPYVALFNLRAEMGRRLQAKMAKKSKL